MKIIHIFYFIFVALGIFIPGSVIMNMFQKRDKEGKVKGAEGFLQAAGAGIVGGLFAATLPKVAEATLANPGLAWFSALILLIVLGAFVGLALLWKEEGSKIGELICALILVILFTILGFQAAHAVSVAVPSAFGQSLIRWVVHVAAVVCSGYIICNWCFFRYKVSEKVGWRIAGIIIMVLTILNLIGSIFTINWLGLKDLDFSDQETVADADVIEEEEPELTAEDLENFTVPVLTAEDLEELTLTKYASISEEFLDSSFSTKDKGRTAETGFSDALTFPFGTPDRFTELEEEILRNPVYSVTVIEALKDKKLGETTIGKLNPWMDEMVLKTDRFGMAAWLEHRDDTEFYVTKEYRIYAATLCTLLERFVEVDGTQTFKTKENWCLSMTSMNNDRRGVKADYQYTGQFYVLVAKTKDGKELLRIGFNTKDKRPAFPEGTPKPGPGPTPTPTPNPDPGPTPTPTPTPTPNPKDKTKGTQGDVVKPNDNPGPGPDTNNPSNPSHSKVEEHPNSTEVKDYKEYKEEMKELEDINKEQKTDKDSNTPSTPTKPNTNVDNNGSKTVDPSKAPGASTEEGKIKNDKTNPAGEWGGPKD